MWFKIKNNNIPFYNRNDDSKKDKYNLFWIISIVCILIFIIIFYSYTQSSKNEFVNILKDTESFYTNNLNFTNIKIETNIEGNRITIIEYKTLDKNDTDEKVNLRLNFLGERIVHYQKTASDTLNWWIAILSILFILATAINFYSYNESKLKLEKAVEEAEGLNRNLQELVEKANNQVNITGNKAISSDDDSKNGVIVNTQARKGERG